MADQRLTGIAAVGRNGVIGVRGDMPWHISEDLRRFKQVTMGGAVIMGRVTFEGIGRPLPGRTSIVVSRRAGPAPDAFSDSGAANPSTRGDPSPGASDPAPTRVIYVNSLDAAVAAADTLGLRAFVAGGAQVYRLAWPLLTDLDITEVDQAPDGDAFFPGIDLAQWAEASREPHDGFAFVHYVRRVRWPSCACG